jgi:DNA polymerase III sliding clamp (beta) subunit (PCNA family)
MTITITPATLESNIQKRFYFWKFGTACVLVPDILFFHITFLKTIMIKFKTKELEQALRIVAPAIGNPTLSACDYVHLSIKGDKATLRATNLNLEITTTCSCTGDVEPFLLPYKSVFNAIAVTLEDEVSITTTDDSISLLLGEDTLNLPIERITIFPKMQEIGETKILAIKEDFITALKVAIKFQEASELKPMINGVLLKFLPDNTCDIARYKC